MLKVIASQAPSLLPRGCPVCLHALTGQCAGLPEPIRELGLVKTVFVNMQVAHFS